MITILIHATNDDYIVIHTTINDLAYIVIQTTNDDYNNSYN